MSNFAFLDPEWPDVYEAATEAEGNITADPRTACFYARRALELAVRWVYKADPAIRLPYRDDLNALLHEPTFKAAVGEAVFAKACLIQRLGNRAVHRPGPVKEFDALSAVRELFHVGYWLARTYGRREKPPAELSFDAEKVPKTETLGQTPTKLRKLEAELEERDKPLSALLVGKGELDEEIKRLRAEVARTKKDANAQPDTHDYSEAETRDRFIDVLLGEAGWPLAHDHDREYEVSGMPNQNGQGFIDYVLWGDDGIPLALVEAKRTKKSAQIGQQQAKLYADCLEARFGRRPVIFYSNGYQHWLWDDQRYPPRAVQGFLTKDQLDLAIQRRTTRKRLADEEINPAIVERYYQTRAIRHICEAFEDHNERKALVVMATGAGKTRTVIALCDLLMRANWVKRVLFLADRVALVNQTVGAFKTHLPESSPVNLVTERQTEGRVYVSTYPSVMRLINEAGEGERRFGIGHFDLVIIDEAHRSVYQKYRAIFEYFDSLLVGLTATPKDEIDVNTYGLFDLERGVPTDAYPLDEAVKDGFLVPPKAISVPLKFPREGIRYDDLDENEREQWDALEWDEDGIVPDRVEAEAVNKWLFNKDTVDKVLETLMTRGQTVSGGDQIAKTIVFAKNQAHAEFIAERFDVNYPQYRGSFARVIHHDVPYAQSLIDDFSNPEKAPHIAISVDMLDTGIDVPEVANLVFFKLVRSKTKFWQMIGRGTRLREDLFGPGLDKEFFYVFDFCQNLEFFGQDPATTEGSHGASLSKRLFGKRLELIGALDGPTTLSSEEDEATELRRELSALLQREVAAMNTGNFVVRPQRELVERFAKPDAWQELNEDARELLASRLAGLPSQLDPENEEAKRFDLLILNLQLAVLRADPTMARLSQQVRVIAALLEEKSAIPAVGDEMELIQEIQTDDWWQGITTGMLESVRKRLRGLVRLIDRRKRQPVYTDFEDMLGHEDEIALSEFASAQTFERYRAKVRDFLRAHEDHAAIQKLRRNRPPTETDLAELERMLLESGIGGEKDLRKAVEQSHGLGLFVRSLVGLDREAAERAFAGFLDGKELNSTQIEFVNLIVDHLMANGVMNAALLYESPFTDIASQGPDGLFNSEQVDDLIAVLDGVRAGAVPPDAAASAG
ncbi:MAG TPA: DEAD/DEAH box helicase family protein [Solirubrobacterales bacterium]|nr:DEAD/DEAH box helicase family protein [Solirubrobacterales bacterium]